MKTNLTIAAYTWLILICMARLFVPTHVDLSPTGILKDVAHVVVTLSVVLAIQSRNWWLGVTVIAASIFELAMALFTR